MAIKDQNKKLVFIKTYKINFEPELIFGLRPADRPGDCLCIGSTTKC